MATDTPKPGDKVALNTPGGWVGFVHRYYDAIGVEVRLTEPTSQAGRMIITHFLNCRVIVEQLRLP